MQKFNSIGCSPDKRQISSQYFLRLALVACSVMLLPVRSLAEGDCKVADTAIKEASAIRGLKMLRKVPCVRQDKKQVSQYLIDTLAEKVPKERLRAEAISYRMLGIIPDSFDYEQGIIKLYTEQIGGYYDPKRKRYVMAAWLPAFMQESIAIHELTHALQDQHFHLEKFTDNLALSSDEQLARAALIEGDAMAVMTDHSMAKRGLPGVSEMSSVSPLMAQSVIGILFTSIQSAPQSLQMIMVFPYISGLNYVHHTLNTKQGYRSVDKLFANPPASTTQVLHPNDEAIPPLKLEDPPCSDLSQSGSVERVSSDTMGEFMISTALSSSGAMSPSIASKAAAGWAGDRLSACASSKLDSVSWHTEWTSPKDAEEFVDAITANFTTRFGDPENSSKVWKKPPYQAQVQFTGGSQRVDVSIERVKNE